MSAFHLDLLPHNWRKLKKAGTAMRTITLLMFLASFCITGSAEPSCAVQMAQLLSTGRFTELASSFKAPAEDISAKLVNAAEYFGSLEQITEASGPRAGTTTRTSIFSSDLPQEYKFDGSWADAVSTKAGAVQVQASSEVGSNCRLLALHIHRQNK